VALAHNKYHFLTNNVALCYLLKFLLNIPKKEKSIPTGHINVIFCELKPLSHAFAETPHPADRRLVG
jgi:hypothetical protein